MLVTSLESRTNPRIRIPPSRRSQSASLHAQARQVCQPLLARERIPLVRRRLCPVSTGPAARSGRSFVLARGGEEAGHLRSVSRHASSSLLLPLLQTLLTIACVRSVSQNRLRQVLHTPRSFPSHRPRPDKRDDQDRRRRHLGDLVASASRRNEVRSSCALSRPPPSLKTSFLPPTLPASSHKTPSSSAPSASATTSASTAPARTTRSGRPSGPWGWTRSLLCSSVYPSPFSHLSLSPQES